MASDSPANSTVDLETLLEETPLNATHHAAIARARDAIENNLPITLIAGPGEWGRAPLLDALAEAAPSDAVIERMEDMPVDLRHLLQRLGAALGVPSAEEPENAAEAASDLRDALEALAAEERRLIFLVDAGAGVSAKALLLLARLGRSAGLCTVVAAREALTSALRESRDERLARLVENAIPVRAFTREEVRALAAEIGADAEEAATLWRESRGAPEHLRVALEAIHAARAEDLEDDPEGAEEPAQAVETEVENLEIESQEIESLEVESLEGERPEDILAAAQGFTPKRKPDPTSADPETDEAFARELDEAAAALSASLDAALAARDMPSRNHPEPDLSEAEFDRWSEDGDADAQAETVWREGARRRPLRAARIAGGGALVIALGLGAVYGLGEAERLGTSGGATEKQGIETANTDATRRSSDDLIAALAAKAPDGAGADDGESSPESIQVDASDPLETADTPTPTAGARDLDALASQPENTDVQAGSQAGASAPRPQQRPLQDAKATPAPAASGDPVRGAAEAAFEAARIGAETLSSAGVLSETLDDLAGEAHARKVALSRARQRDSLDADAVEQRVRAALILADRRIAVKQFTKPTGASAYDVLLNAWEVAPEDARLAKRFNRLMEIYRGEARRALSQERFTDFYRFNTIVDRIAARRPV